MGPSDLFELDYRADICDQFGLGYQLLDLSFLNPFFYSKVLSKCKLYTKFDYAQDNRNANNKIIRNNSRPIGNNIFQILNNKSKHKYRLRKTAFLSSPTLGVAFGVALTTGSSSSEESESEDDTIFAATVFFDVQPS